MTKSNDGKQLVLFFIMHGHGDLDLPLFLWE